MSDRPVYEFPADLIEKLRAARHVAVLTGAGVSAESGIPTFRDALTGLWAKYDPMTLATREAFQENPRLVWEWYTWRRNRVGEADPNPAHYALVEIERRVPHFTLITQNVDGLHHRAGSVHVIELHGNITRVKRFDDDVIVERWEDNGLDPVRCPDTGSLLRPDVVWFGELLPAEALQTAQAAAVNCDIFFTIGTAAMVEPAASLPRLAMNYGTPVVIVNPAVTLRSSSSLYLLKGPAGQILPALVQATWGV
ncbi:MAG: NAD-dependent deacylase [Chloroflexaceae bacterium]|nr:NAD-dependent deacylase [Chloroflexaceae bacterium]NJO07367.1 NAD-dependent deacylase [Chloroflexaceae bacterium]